MWFIKQKRGNLFIWKPKNCSKITKKPLFFPLFGKKSFLNQTTYVLKNRLYQPSFLNRDSFLNQAFLNQDSTVQSQTTITFYVWFKFLWNRRQFILSCSSYIFTKYEFRISPWIFQPIRMFTFPFLNDSRMLSLLKLYSTLTTLKL